MFWGVTLESGKRYSQIVESSYHLSMAALEPNSREARKPNKHVSVMIEHGKTEFLLCTLEYDRVMQVALDLLFVEGEEVSFFLNGEGVVHLTGYVTDNEDKATVISDQNDEESDSILSDTDDESCSKLMSLDNESDSTGEEWTPEKAALKKKKKLKAGNVTKVMEEKKSQKQSKDTSSSSLAAESTEKPKDDTENISLSSESDDDMEDVESDDDDDDEESEESELSVQDDDDEEEEESEEETDNEKAIPPPPTKKKKSIENNKSLSPAKTLTLTESSKKKLNKTPMLNEVPKPSGSTSNIPINKSIESPVSKKKPETVDNRKKPETPFKKKSEGDNFQKSKVETPSANRIDNTPKTINESAVSTGKKKKKKRSRSEENSSSFTETPKQDTPSMKLQSGIKVTEIKQGNGPQAKKGRFVHVCYVGRLNSGQEFDSARDRPFSFRLGCGEVIKGLDTGIEGMKVGGKRKLVIPPNQGYGGKKVGPIPPNSTLQFEVELKAVS